MKAVQNNRFLYAPGLGIHRLLGLLTSSAVPLAEAKLKQTEATHRFNTSYCCEALILVCARPGEHAHVSLSRVPAVSEILFRALGEGLGARAPRRRCKRTRGRRAAHSRTLYSTSEGDVTARNLSHFLLLATTVAAQVEPGESQASKVT